MLRPVSPEAHWAQRSASGVRLRVQVTPNAKKSEIVGVQDGALKIKLQAQPIEGKANDALVRFLAGLLGVPRRTVTLTHGATSRLKVLEVGLDYEAVLQTVEPLLLHTGQAGKS
jgi:uncharacterized protein (TIGR00251 family)